MNFKLILMAIIIFIIISGLINAIKSLDDEVDKRSNYSTKHQEYYGQNIIGEQTICLNGLSLVEKRKVWDASSIKAEMIALFPKFDDMSIFVEEHVVDDGDFKQNLLVEIDELKGDYITGAITSEKVKSSLLSL